MFIGSKAQGDPSSGPIGGNKRMRGLQSLPKLSIRPNHKESKRRENAESHPGCLKMGNGIPAGFKLGSAGLGNKMA